MQINCSFDVLEFQNRRGWFAGCSIDRGTWGSDVRFVAAKAAQGLFLRVLIDENQCYYVVELAHKGWDGQRKERIRMMWLQ